MESSTAERPLAVVKLSGWPVWPVSRLAVLMPGDRNARVRHIVHRRGQEPDSRRLTVARYGCFGQPCSTKDEFNRGDQHVIRRRYSRAAS
jgi:hypothetical protein